MSLTSQIADAVDQAFMALDDIPRSIVIASLGNSNYDPTTGATGYSGGTSKTVKAAMVSYLRSEIDGEKVRDTDQKAIVRQREMGSMVPAIGNTVTDLGKSYRVINVGQDPARVSWVLQLRAP